tara:strand:- start:324 stop:560 length:237 start_codon:yes stop_codon:yes gene_type:complete
METAIVRYLFIFLAITIPILIYSVWKYPNAVKYLLKELAVRIGLVLFLGVIIYLLFFTPVEKAPIGEEPDWCPRGLVC